MKRIVFGIVFLMMIAAVAGQPTGSNIVEGQSSRATAPNATNVTSEGGNVTWIEADISQMTNVWQGYFGVVTGGILLEDGSGNRFYDWDVVDAVGEIFAAREEISDWTAVNCTNQSQIYIEEDSLNIPNESSDGINDTFTLTSHPSFDVGSRVLSGCRATQTYNSTQQDTFWNVLLNTDADTTVYTTILEESANAYNDSQVDFQMIVPVDRSTGFATYYMYVELG